MLNSDNVYEALKKIIDPEIGHNIVDLGLIYGVEISKEEKQVLVKMTLTSPSCPLGPYFVDRVKTEIRETLGLPDLDVEVDIVFDPPWSMEAMSEELRLTLGF